MNPFSIKFRLLLTIILVMYLSASLEPATAATSVNDSDRLALLDFKNHITKDPSQIMNSWNATTHFCNWVGVECNHSTKRVMILNLQAYDLVGTIPPSLGNLTFLTRINLQNNSFHGNIPQEIGRLINLQHLNLSRNSFNGIIPNNISRCRELRILHISYNDLIGEIPDSFSSLSKLTAIRMTANKLTGKIPPWIGNFSSLWVLALGQNNMEGTIPYEFGRLSNLGYLELSLNRLSGTIPSSIYNVSALFLLTVSQNLLQGTLPPNIGLTLPNLEVFAIAMNNLTGQIPVSFSNASKMMVLEFSLNRFTGPVPRDLGRLKMLSRLNFEDNRLGFEEPRNLNFLTTLTNCTNLKVLGLAGNLFQGEMPVSITNLSSQLGILTMGSNLLHGNIPVGIEKLVSLTLLGLENNSLTGFVPSGLGKFSKLEGLYLNDNRFTGSIPYSFGNMTSLSRLYMERNRLIGNIPISLENCQNLQELSLSDNNLSGKIPKQVIGLSSISVIVDMSRNSFTGSLPSELGNLRNLVELRVSDNKLSGEIPSTIGTCVRLERLHMDANQFRGTIPRSLEALSGLTFLDVSHNNLSGKVPDFLGKLPSLKSLNLSFNSFEGEIPKGGIFDDYDAIRVLGNVKLCSDNNELHLPTCSKKVMSFRNLMVLIAAVILLLIISSLSAWYVIRRRSSRKHSDTSPDDSWQSGVSYLDLAKSTNGFSGENLLGTGSFGSVYKGVRPGDGGILAVKVFNLETHGASKSFINECNALRSIRHRNLLKIITACSSIDHLGNDFKGLVFEFMPNGSLDQWLHPKSDEMRSLSFMQRLGIAIDIASALRYLHHGCHTPIVHCDLKPSNILLDQDMTAHVGDFGLARLLFDSSDPSFSRTMSIGLRGSVGYIPPEYGTGSEVSIHGDVYSYGIVLLEMITGKGPTDDMFKDGLNIHNFVSNALPGHVMDIVDPTMIFADENQVIDDAGGAGRRETNAIIHYSDAGTSRGKREDCLVEIMEIGLACSGFLTKERVSMENVEMTLHRIREIYIGPSNRRNRRIRR